MTYHRPEVAALGNAAILIQGFKFLVNLESSSLIRHFIPDCDFDD
jgi:hypothetical protein